jgi:hypothetical protein
MIPYDYYVMFRAVKAHFLTPNYDYHKYRGKLPADPKKFDTGKMKFIFLKLSKKYDESEILDLYVANIFHAPHLWAGDLTTDEAHRRYLEFRARKQAFTYEFRKDLEYLKSLGEIHDLFVCEGGQNPRILTETYKKKISVETFIVLNIFLKFFDKLTNDLTDDIIWPSFRNRCEALQPFLEFDKSIAKQILLETL